MRRYWGHASAVILLGGWLLMTPPFASKGPAWLDDPVNIVDATFTGKLWLLDTDKPVNQWDQDSAYDTAAQCEEAKSHEWKDASDGLAKAVRDGPKDLKKNHMAQIKSLSAYTMNHARCVPADAVYPAQQPHSGP